MTTFDELVESVPLRQESFDVHRRFMDSLYFATRCAAVVDHSPVFRTPIFCPNTAFGAAYEFCEEHR